MVPFSFLKEHKLKPDQDLNLGVAGIGTEFGGQNMENGNNMRNFSVIKCFRKLSFKILGTKF